MLRWRCDKYVSHADANLLNPVHSPCSTILTGSQGAIVAFGAIITVGQGSTITSNTAVSGAGGGIYCSSSAANFNGTVFTANKAVWGGGEDVHVTDCFVVPSTC